MQESRVRKLSWLDLAVVAICLMVLAGLFLPAIQYTNHSRTRSACQNNLRQLVLAATNYEVQSQHFPANRQIRRSSSGPLTVGWVFDIMPFLEHQNYYDKLKRDAADTAANETKISILICPHDSTISRSTDTSYQANGGCPNNQSDNFDASANGVGDDLAGEYRPATRARMVDVRDGTTSTIYYVENLNAQRWNEDFYHPKEQSREYFHAITWIPVDEAELDGVFRSTNPITPPKQLWAINAGDFTRCGPEFARPSSDHSTGFQAAFVGGQTKVINETIDYGVYARLLSGNGEKTLDPSDQSESKTASVRQWQQQNLLPQQYE
jgi:hypothetical protein